jgi:hypothetical protein
MRLSWQMFDRSHSHPHRGRRSATVAIRRTDADADGALAAVAARDSQRLPDGPWLVAEVEGRTVAVLSLPAGSFVADPFTHTVQLRALLELRAAQLDGGAREPRRWI